MDAKLAEGIDRLLDKQISFIELSGVTVKKAVDEVVVHRQMQKKAKDAAPAALDALLKSGCIEPGEREAAVAMLGGHAETLALLKRAADRIGQYRAAEAKRNASGLGGGVPEDTVKAAYDSCNDGYIGRRTAAVKESDRAILQVLR